VAIFDRWRAREQLVVPREAIDVVFHDAQVGHRRGEVDVHHRGEVTVEVVRRDVHVERFGGVGDLHGLPYSVPDGIDDRDVHRLFLEIQQELAHPEEGFARTDRVPALLADVGERLGVVDVELDPEEVEVFESAYDADESFRPGVEIQVQQDLYIRPRAVAKRLKMGPDAPDERLVDVETGGERGAEARHPGADRSVLVAEHVRLERGKSHLAGILARLSHTVEVRDGGGVERGMVDAPARAVRPVDGNDVPLLTAKQVVDGHAQGLGFGVQQRVFDGTERLGAQSVRSGSRGGRKSGVEALMVVYLLADQTVSIPLDDGREPGRPEGLVEFAPADDAVIGDELEKMIVTPSGIAGQRFDPLDYHRPGSSLGAGSLSTASRWLYSSTRPRFTQGHKKLLLGGRPRSARRAHGACVMPLEDTAGGTHAKSKTRAST
jgi:hypothetical protein